ncbi:DUF4375 domain-containing protein [Hymenobacter sp. H14-R3]|uniref:DMP19 family protein n=1 Tax=Hymenobacter sp. H14-R3 TaxID=3046308 RepID=UPI0024BA21A0|nr:DUF4375 domain-containing protein [Hymenobacter sp. H14-R3]MDJ0364802.1 DUF4375 domain-containing protein [Hymenobacter sp. H14-R3]
MLDLQGLTDDELLSQVVEYAFQHEAHLVELSWPVQTVYFISNFEAEFYNGGIQQFLTNSAGRFAGETADSFARIGAPKLASLLQEAAALQLESTNSAAALGGLNDELHAAYPTNEDGNVGDQLTAYLRQYPGGLLLGAD